MSVIPSAAQQQQMSRIAAAQRDAFAARARARLAISMHAMELMREKDDADSVVETMATRGPSTMSLTTGMTMSNAIAAGRAAPTSRRRRRSEPPLPPRSARIKQVRAAPTRELATSTDATRQEVSSDSSGSNVSPVMKPQNVSDATAIQDKARISRTGVGVSPAVLRTDIFEAPIASIRFLRSISGAWASGVGHSE